jgi:FlaA1/EpsC-like NDP-sugar epimerase
MKITTARFANVAFSNGSLPAGFIDRMLKHQPLSCPSDVKRFFVSPEESGQICLCACILGQSGDIFFPKLGNDTMINFANIAKEFVQENGFKVKECTSEIEAKQSAKEIDAGTYPIYFFNSNTSGEKLYEEFYTEEETLDLDKCINLGIVKNAPKRSKKELNNIIAEIQGLFAKEEFTKKDIVDLLNKMIPNFQHIETGLSLDQKM